MNPIPPLHTQNHTPTPEHLVTSCRNSVLGTHLEDITLDHYQNLQDGSCECDNFPGTDQPASRGFKSLTSVIYKLG